MLIFFTVEIKLKTYCLSFDNNNDKYIIYELRELTLFSDLIELIGAITS